MKKMKLWMMAAILFCGAGCLTSCNGNDNAGKADNAKKAAEAAEVKVGVEDGIDIVAVVDKYLTDSIGAHYSQGEFCIPCATILASNHKNPDSVLVWGDFWVFNYKQVGDTLKTVSGGDHPGMMCIQKADDGTFKVTAFEQVEDGHGNLESAKRIFGKMYEGFHRFNSDEKKREDARAIAIANYVKAHNLPVKYYQDYGWDAVKIPLKK